MSFEVSRGDIVGLVGLNGSGKSTLLKILAGAIPADGGEGQVHGVHLGGSKTPFCGLLLENPPFIDDFSGRDNLVSLAKLRRIATGKDVTDSLDAVGLDPYSRKPVRHYSQGMRQRLGLAQALMEHPPLLLLDEPLNGLDPTGILDVRHLILSAHRNGATIIFSSHVLSEVQKICTRLLVLHEGSLVELDTSAFSSLDSLESAYGEVTGYSHA